MGDTPKRAWSEDFEKTLEIIAYGKKRGQFTVEDLKRDTGLNDGQVRLYGTRSGGVLEETARQGDIPYYSVTIEAFGVYLNHVSLLQAQEQANKAYRMATIGVIIALLAIAVAVFIDAGGVRWFHALASK